MSDSSAKLPRSRPIGDGLRRLKISPIEGVCRAFLEDVEPHGRAGLGGSRLSSSVSSCHYLVIPIWALNMHILFIIV